MPDPQYSPAMGGEIKRALESATPDWQQADGSPEAFHEGSYAITCRYPNGSGRRILAKLNTNLPFEANAHLIANAPAWLAAQQDEIERLRQWQQDAVPVLTVFRDQFKGDTPATDRLLEAANDNA